MDMLIELRERRRRGETEGRRERGGGERQTDIDVEEKH